MVVPAHVVVVVAAGGLVFCLAHDSLVALVWQFSLLPPCLVVSAPTRRTSSSGLLFLLLAVCPMRACHDASQLSRQSTRGNTCGRFVVTEILEQACVLILRIFQCCAFPESVIDIVSGVSASLVPAVQRKPRIVEEVFVPQARCNDSSECDLVYLVMFVDVGHGQCAIILRSTVNSLSPRFGFSDVVFAAGSPDGLLNRLDWFVLYVDSCFSWLAEPKVFVDLGSPFVHVVEDDGNVSVGS